MLRIMQFYLSNFKSTKPEKSTIRSGINSSNFSLITFKIELTSKYAPKIRPIATAPKTTDTNIFHSPLSISSNGFLYILHDKGLDLIYPIDKIL